MDEGGAVVTPLLVDNNLFENFFCRPISCLSAAAKTNIARVRTHTHRKFTDITFAPHPPLITYIQNTTVEEFGRRFFNAYLFFNRYILFCSPQKYHADCCVSRSHATASQK